jgi:hypothetical protein
VLGGDTRLGGDPGVAEALVIHLVLQFRSPMPIIQYDNYVFTNDGQSSVAEFEAKLIPAASAIRAAGALTVIVGYHGDQSGVFAARFSPMEMQAVRWMRLSFSDATLRVLDADMSGGDIDNAVRAGRVFFTWCDSDTRVRNVMGGGMPGEVARF